MLNQIGSTFGYLLIFSIVIFLVYTITKSFLALRALKKFITEIENELRVELTRAYFQLVQGEIEVEDFYEKELRLGQLYSKIFEDYKKGMFKNYSKPRKGRTKVK